MAAARTQLYYRTPDDARYDVQRKHRRQISLAMLLSLALTGVMVILFSLIAGNIAAPGQTPEHNPGKVLFHHR